ncbi:MFS transporter [Diaminobutyricibacter tongyongensis]|uniref:MFS transporter n=1 Tax=Leifsonia tongyongensis TaxID=1268043 RepID=A0A6L9Y2R2_9MICO|nr:MFS transporter [Diaminobutyricibacter tongyongensis]NEN07960.1 MFS transporter [Diaminobutyricibacter tongyongensis]
MRNESVPRAERNHARPMRQLPPALVASYAGSPERTRSLFRRTLVIVIVSQVFGGAGLAAGVTVGALLAESMLGAPGFAGLSAALFTLGSAAAAFVVGRVSQRQGRRSGLTAGFLAGAAGALGVIAAATIGSVPLLFISFFVYGAGIATNLQARYAGTDLAPPHRRGTAVSLALVSTTLGAVAGPNLVTPMGRVATSLGIPALAGPFLLAAAAYLIAGVVLLVWLRPDPLLLAAAIEGASARAGVDATAEGSALTALRNRGVVVGATVMVLTQVAMVAIMTMTPVYMGAHGHGLTEVGVVIGIHIGAMYLPSLVTGVLVDKLGRMFMAIAAGVTLLAAGIVSATAPPDSLAQLVLALTLLGLGWNFGLISGTALVVDATTPQNRAKTQGSIDVLIALTGSAGGALSGVVMASTSYALLSLAGGILSILLIPVVLWSRRPTAAA